MRRAEIALDEDAVGFDHGNNTLVIQVGGMLRSEAAHARVRRVRKPP